MGSESHNYPPQQPPPYPGHQQPSYPVTNQPQVNIIRGPTIVPVIVNSMGPASTVTVCQSCGQHISTRVERIPSMRTHLFAILLCLVGCWPCACVPYCVDTCNNAEHYCPNCNSYIGSYLGA
ncbi:lipopolysaccharide-induced tumor necrosis factor-alpha factor homolog [Leptidea sinapis]|uniref:lipopolysaccharide-induced tumor necrosis factor-alpha factor homolog n=1 Tax=Leptidea sinapis TaxID=189913 RepID=UPI00213204F8|nr:lipopolysaccharide-induced tumor necrosis factor-alpha factor homolog [Leptidea sinapis]